MRTFFARLREALKAVRAGRLVVVLLASLVAGLACDWLRTEQRLVFPRPLPVFKTTAPLR
jgi:hypothetical protein